MKGTQKIVEEVAPKLERMRKKKAKDLQEDLLKTLKTVIKKLPKEELERAETISVTYFVKSNSEKIYRSKYVEVNEKRYKYEDKDIFLGTKIELSKAFKFLYKELEKDRYFSVEFFEPDKLTENCEAYQTPVDFLVYKIENK